MPQITTLSTEENSWSRSLSLANDRLENLVNAANDPQKQLETAEQHKKDLQVALEAKQR
jgi:hypothetical protein